MDCVFCKIVKNEIPKHQVYEDERILAFLDIHPINDGNVVVIPKEHVEQIWDMDDQLYQHLMQVAKKISHRIREVLNPFRVGVIVEGFEVPHAHYHLLPLDEGMKQSLENRNQGDVDHDKLAEIAKKLAL